MKAMIFAAGLGTRLKPLTDRMPKALVEVAGKPLLQHQLEKLRKAGATDIVVNVHHFADMIEEWVAAHPVEGLNIRFSDERQQLLETGGGIRKARPLLGEGRILVHNCDILSNADLKAFYAKGEGAAATLMVSERETTRYLLFDDDMNLRGWTNVKTGEVKGIGRKGRLPEGSLHKLAFSGIHQISSEAFPLMDEFPEKFGIIDFYLRLAGEMKVKGVKEEGLRLMDVGKLETLSEAERFIRELEAGA